MKRVNINNKKGQLAIFIILALAIVIVLILLFVNRGVLPTVFAGQSPIEQIRQCAEVNIKPSINNLSLQGGFLEPELYYLYQGNKIEYLCYTEEYSKACIMQKPFLKQNIENEIKKYIEPEATRCINSVINSMQENGYSVSYKKPEISISLVPNNIIIDVALDLRLEKGSVESYKSIKTSVDSNLYNMAFIAGAISNQEAAYGDSEIMTYMVYYPSLKVEKKKQGDGTKVYILTDKTSQEEFMFASRSYVIPPGLTGA